MTKKIEYFILLVAGVSSIQAGNLRIIGESNSSTAVVNTLEPVVLMVSGKEIESFYSPDGDLIFRNQNVRVPKLKLPIFRTDSVLISLDANTVGRLVGTGEKNIFTFVNLTHTSAFQSLLNEGIQKLAEDGYIEYLANGAIVLSDAFNILSHQTKMRILREVLTDDFIRNLRNLALKVESKYPDDWSINVNLKRELTFFTSSIGIGCMPINPEQYYITEEVIGEIKEILFRLCMKGRSLGFNGKKFVLANDPASIVQRLDFYIEPGSDDEIEWHIQTESDIENASSKDPLELKLSGIPMMLEEDKGKEYFVTIREEDMFLVNGCRVWNLFLEDSMDRNKLGLRVLTIRPALNGQPYLINMDTCPFDLINNFESIQKSRTKEEQKRNLDLLDRWLSTYLHYLGHEGRLYLSYNNTFTGGYLKSSTFWSGDDDSKNLTGLNKLYRYIKVLAFSDDENREVCKSIKGRLEKIFASSES